MPRRALGHNGGRGRFEGREAIREWAQRTMTSFPGNEMVAFPANWHTVDMERERGWVICEVANPMRDPGDGTVVSPSTRRWPMRREPGPKGSGSRSESVPDRPEEHTSELQSLM